MDLVPLYSRIIVKRKDMEKTAGGIYIPTSADSQKATEGEVIAVGEECDTVKVGEIVFWGKYAGGEIERNRETFIVMNEEDVIARVMKGEENA